MKTKLAQSLPLLGTFLALIIGGAVLFKFTPADAVLDAEATDVPPINTSTEVEDAQVISATTDTNGDPIVVGGLVDPEVNDEFILDDMDSRVANSAATTTEVHGMYAEGNEDVVLADHYLNDVYVAGQTVTITGNVDGDVFAAGEHIVIEGTVMGSVRVAGSDVIIKGSVGRNVMAFAGDVQITRSAHIAGDVLIYAADATIKAMVMGNVTGGAEEFTIDSPVEGNVNISGVSALTFGPGAYVMGTVTYTSAQPAMVDEAATILGDVQFTQELSEDNNVDVTSAAILTIFKVAKTIIFWIGLLILGVVMIKLMPKFSQAVVTDMKQHAGKNLGYGTLVLICMPILLVIIGATVIGLPLAFAGFLVYLLIVMAGKIYFGLTIGKILLKNSQGLVGPFLLGFTIVYLLTGTISWLGFGWMVVAESVFALGMVWAMGSIVTQCRRNKA